MAKSVGNLAGESRSDPGPHADLLPPAGEVGRTNQGESGSAGSAAGGRPLANEGAPGGRPLGAPTGPQLADLIPGPTADLARSVSMDFRFANAYPFLWCVLSCQRDAKGQPRAPGELRIVADGAVWVVGLTLPEEELTLQAEAQELSDVFASLEARLATRPIPYRKAGRYVRKKQLSPKQKGVAKQS